MRRARIFQKSYKKHEWKEKNRRLGILLLRKKLKEREIPLFEVGEILGISNHHIYNSLSGKLSTNPKIDTESLVILELSNLKGFTRQDWFDIYKACILSDGLSICKEALVMSEILSDVLINLATSTEKYEKT